MSTRLHCIALLLARTTLGCIALAGGLAAQGSIVTVDPRFAGGSDGVGGIEVSVPGGPKGSVAGPNGGSGTPSGSVLDLTAKPHDDVLARLPATRDLGHALPGDGDAPQLTATLADETLVLRIEHALPDARAVLVLGLDALDVPFRGGVLVPSPDLLLTGLRIDAEGTLALPVPHLPDGLSFCAQVWIDDPSGPRGATASNALAVLPHDG